MACVELYAWNVSLRRMPDVYAWGVHIRWVIMIGAS